MTQFSLHQTLHGYDGGHRLLASSRPLVPEANRILSVLSDRSGEFREMPDTGYITGYPLNSMGVYVFARTWPAHEVSRPGSVWTHSLLIDFTELGRLQDLRVLASYFRRPVHPSDRHSYKSVIASSPTPWLQAEMDREFAYVLLGALYKTPTRQVFLKRQCNEIDEATLEAVWSQQWPRLRREFRFCTYVDKDRSFGETVFDLQIGPRLKSTNNGSMETPQDMFTEELTTGVYWQKIAMQDLIYGNSEFREFLKRTASDLAKGRARFRDLCRLYVALEGGKNSPDLVFALKFANDALYQKEGRFLRRRILTEAIRNIDHLDPIMVEQLLVSISELTDDAREELVPVLVEKLWLHYPQTLLNSGPMVLNNFLPNYLARLDVDELLLGVKKAPELINVVLASKPAVVGEASFWEGPFDDALLSVLANWHSYELNDNAVNAICKAGRKDLAKQLVSLIGGEQLAIYSSYIFDTDKAEVARYFFDQSITKYNKANICERLLDVNNRSVAKWAIVDLSRCFVSRYDIQTYPRTRGHSGDIWLARWQMALGEVSEQDNQAMCAFLFCRAFFANPADASELLKSTFDRIILYAQSQKLEYENSYLISQVLSSVRYWRDSQIENIFKGVAKLIAQRDFSLSEFLKITALKSSRYKLLAFIEKEYNGKRYLRKLERESWSSGEKDSLFANELRKFLDERDFG